MAERYLPERFERRKTRPVHVGNVVIGGDAPVVVQSMVTPHTQDIENVVSQTIQLHKEGAEIVRVTTPTMADARALGEIKPELRKSYQDVPIVADVHHNGLRIALLAAENADKIRINTGLYVFKVERKSEYTDVDVEKELDDIRKALNPLIAKCKQKGIPLRLGSNHGSLSDRIMVMYGDTPKGMVVSVMEYIQICEEEGFGDLVLSLKSSDVSAMQEANRLMVRVMEEHGMRYPIHLGVTEAGFGSMARTKSSVGIGALLSEGIGDAIRVSLAEDPIEEIKVCYEILQAAGVRRTLTEIIVCPTCGRTESGEVIELAKKVEAVLHPRSGLRIAVMGCVVNGPGEARGADYGFWATTGKWEFRRKYEKIGTLELENLDGAVDLMVDVLKADGRYKAPIAA